MSTLGFPEIFLAKGGREGDHPDMSVAALYDIHGNLPALEAVVAELRGRRVDVVVFGGDLCWGPFPAETLELVRSLDIPALYVRGNADREVADPSGAGLTGWTAEVNDWCAQEVGAEGRSFLGALPGTVDEKIEGLGSVLFCHGSPARDDDVFTRLTDEARIAAMLESVTQDVVVCGHTHVAFRRYIGDQLLVNPGSLGMPAASKPGAYWGLLDDRGVHLMGTYYDPDAAARRIRATGCPHAEVFAGAVLNPADPDELTNFYEARVSI